MKTISWLFFRIAIPDDWEMTKYSLTHSSGLCVFSDESVERLRFSWQHTKRPVGAPLQADLEQRLNLCRRELSRKHRDASMSDIHTVGNNWTALRVEGEKSVLICARYLGEGEYLCEAEVNIDDPKEEERAVVALGTVAKRSPGEWEAYNLHFSLPNPWELSAAKVYPGSTELEFHHGEEELRLFSINPRAVDRTLDNLMGSLMEAKERIVSDDTRNINRHRAQRINTSCLSGRGFVARLRRQRDHYSYIGWKCDIGHHRLMLLRYRRTDPRRELPEGLKIWCCE